MPDLVEHMYCSQQINIPAAFPYILKQYMKAAIRTQPYDLLRWTSAYFRAMAAGEVPPIKPRFEHVPLDQPPGLTPGYLRVLLRQLGRKGTVTMATLYEKWDGVCLSEESLRELLEVGEFGEEIDWLQFVAVAAGHITRSLGETMILLCELLSREPEGGSATILCDTFNDLYTYLAKLECGPPEPSAQIVSLSEEDLVEPATPSSTTVSAESVGEEPMLPPLVDYRPSSLHFEVEGEGLNEGETQVKVKVEGGEEPCELNVAKQDEETQTDAGSQTSVCRRRVFVAGIKPALPDDQIEAVVKYMEWWAERQEGMAMPRNIRHFLCPPLDHLPLPDPSTDRYHYPNTNINP